MYRKRRYPRYVSRSLKSKYSNETFNFVDQVNWTGGKVQQAQACMITAIPNQGMRKVKNFELSLTGGPMMDSSGTIHDIPLLWALVFVPEGTPPTQLKLGEASAPASLYEPNQNVIMSGCWPNNITSPYVVKTRLARNLNAGDSIWLLMINASTFSDNTSKMICATLNYSISF